MANRPPVVPEVLPLVRDKLAPLPDPLVPTLNLIEPLCREELPVEIITDPPTPVVEVPVLNVILPEEADAALLAVMRLILPEFPEVEYPENTLTLPPVTAALPALNSSEPPIPDLPAPTTNEILPPEPLVAEPDPIRIAPLLPTFEEPELNVNQPLAPAVPELLVESKILPLDAPPIPLINLIKPPDRAEELPEYKDNEDPFPELPDPTLILIVPEPPESEPPVDTEIEPLLILVVNTLPVLRDIEPLAPEEGEL